MRLTVPAFRARVFSIDVTSLRADGLIQWNANLWHDLQIHEGLTFEVRVEPLNLFNRSQFAVPNNNPFNIIFRKVTANTATLHRFYQLQGRIRI